MARKRFNLRAVAQWLRDQVREEFPDVQANPYNIERAILWAEERLNSKLSNSVKRNLILIPCPHTPGMLHLAYGRKRVDFRECGCHS